MDYNKDIDKSLIGPEYLPAWEKFGLFGLKCKNDSPSIRAYSMANYPAEGDRIMLTGAYRHAAVQTETTSWFHGCDAGYRFFLYLYLETG